LSTPPISEGSAPSSDDSSLLLIIVGAAGTGFFVLLFVAYMARGYIQKRFYSTYKLKICNDTSEWLRYEVHAKHVKRESVGGISGKGLIMKNKSISEEGDEMRTGTIAPKSERIAHLENQYAYVAISFCHFFE
jgi:hypothetical protein